MSNLICLDKKEEEELHTYTHIKQIKTKQKQSKNNNYKNDKQLLNKFKMNTYKQINENCLLFIHLYLISISIRLQGHTCMCHTIIISIGEYANIHDKLCTILFVFCNDDYRRFFYHHH